MSGIDYDILARMVETDRRPQGGDLVRLAAPWQWGMIPAGRLGTIQGIVADLPIDSWHSIIFATYSFHGRNCEPMDTVHTAHWANQPKFASTSGGPGTIATPMWELMPTDERVTVTCWRWRDTPRANGGIDFRIELPVWLWIPN